MRAETVTRRGALALAASLGAGAAAPRQAAASFTILADLAREALGPGASVSSLAPIGADPHRFEPAPSQSRLLAQSELLALIGLGFDAWAERLARAAGFKGRTLRLGEALGGYPLLAGGHSHAQDPHIWQDVSAARLMVRAIGGAGAQAYSERLFFLDAEIKGILAPIPTARRVLVTSHDSFAYFGRAYGFKVVAAHGAGPAAEPSAQRLAALIRTLRETKAPAVFAEYLANPRIAARIAAETGARVGAKLYTDTLTASDGPAPTYIELMRANARAIAAALA